MPLALNANAIIKCSHMGTFKMTPTVGSTVMINGAPAIVLTDMAVPHDAVPVRDPAAGGSRPDAVHHARPVRR